MAEAGGGVATTAPSDPTTLVTSRGGACAGGENSAGAWPVVYQSSKPGATTPMVGISSGPPTIWKSSAAIGAASLVAASALPAFADPTTVVCAMARSEAIVSAVAPAPSTAAALEERWSAPVLPMKTLVSFRNERGSILGARGPPDHGLGHR